MTWAEASGNYWMAALIIGVLGYIKQRELLWRDEYRNTDPLHGTFTRNPILPCEYLGAFSLGEFWGYLIQVFGTPLPVFFSKLLTRLWAVLPLQMVDALGTAWVVATAILLPLVVEIFVDR